MKCSGVAQPPPPYAYNTAPLHVQQEPATGVYDQGARFDNITKPTVPVSF